MDVVHCDGSITEDTEEDIELEEQDSDMISIQDEDSDKAGENNTKSEAKTYPEELQCYDRHLKKDRRWVLLHRKIYIKTMQGKIPQDVE